MLYELTEIKDFVVVLLFVPSWKPRFQVNWRLLVKERISNISKLEVFFFFFGRLYWFLAARAALEVWFMVGPSVCPLENFVKKWPL